MASALIFFSNFTNGIRIDAYIAIIVRLAAGDTLATTIKQFQLT
jgi:dolichol kinase